MRKFCLDCVRKHLSSAMICNLECEMGYPEHEILVIGNLTEAEQECFGASEDLSLEIRQWRLLYMKDNKVQIPYLDLYAKTKQIIEQKGCGTCQEASDSFKERLLKKSQSL